jgi:hypothetical protein
MWGHPRHSEEIMAEGALNARERIDRRRFGEPMKRALRRVLNGESYRQAAEAEGIDHADVYKAAKSIPGLREAHLKAWRESWGPAFPKVWRQHLERIEPRSAMPKAS